MLCHSDNVYDVAHTSFLSNPGVSLWMTKGNVQYYAFQFSLCNRKFLIALINAEDSHP